jgi:hypothetical protein
MAILNAFGIGEEHQQTRVFSLSSLPVRTLMFPLICGLFLMSLMVQDLAFSQQFAGRFGVNIALFLSPAMLFWTRDSLRAITVVWLHFFSYWLSLNVFYVDFFNGIFVRTLRTSAFSSESWL